MGGGVKISKSGTPATTPSAFKVIAVFRALFPPSGIALKTIFGRIAFIFLERIF
jgi:hypothetical protein